MLRNYLMPGFALVLLTVFAAPRSTPSGAESAGRRAQTESSPSGAEAPNNASSGRVLQLGGKRLFNPKDVCSVAKDEMHEKLSEFGVDFPDIDETGKPAASIKTGTKELGPPTEAMIALLPDPVHTHLALRFDRYIDVLQQAMQDSISEKTQGWIYVSQWLPWDPVPYSASQDPINRANVHMFDADRECAPGVLIFRRNKYQQASVQGEFLLVFLVGESPTSGILHQDQFLYAMQSWHTIQLRREALARGDAALARQKVAEAEKAATQQGKEKRIQAQQSQQQQVQQPQVMDHAPQKPPDRNQGKEAADTSAGTNHPDGPLRILGPAFSSSLPALDSLLTANKCRAGDKSQKTCFKAAQVVSGSVSTSRWVINKSGNFPGLSDAQFISMNESSDAIQEMLLNYLEAREHISRSQVAFISEDETAYGNLLSSMQSSHNAFGSGRPLLFHYPREISQLRNAYEKSSIFHRSSQSQSSDNTNQQDLTLSLEDRHEEEDSVPSFSENQSPISEESVLSAMTRAMDREHVRVAVINGSDVLDVIFVARYFSRNLPDVRVVLLNADLLFERSPDVSDFRGMLMANTYPLISDNISWTGRFMHMPKNAANPGQSSGDSGANERDHPGPFGTYLPERVFSSYESTGIYNAVRVLEMAPLKFPDLNQPSANGSAETTGDKSTSPPSAAPEPPKPLWLAEYTDPFHGGNHPPLWLNAVGRGGFWPVALLDRYQLDRSQPGSDTQGKTSLADIPGISDDGASGNETIPSSMFDGWSPSRFHFAGIHFDRLVARKLVVARLSVVCLLALFVLFGIVLCTFARLERWPEYVFDIKGTNSERRGWIVLVIILSFSWIARLLLLDLPGWRLFQDPVNLGIIFLQIVLLLFALWLVRKGLWEGQRRYFAWLLIALTTVTQFAFSWIKPDDFSAKIFYLYRSEHLFNGLSPVMPFIFLAIAVVCLVSRHIHSLLIFSPRLMPRIPCYEGSRSPEMLRTIHRCAINDILRACYSPWRMLASKLRHLLPNRKLDRKQDNEANQPQDQTLQPNLNIREKRLNRLRKQSGCPPVGNIPKLPAVLLAVTLVLLLVAAYLLFPRGFETFETRAYAIWLSICSFAILLFLLHEIGWVILMWICLHKGLLNPLERTTLRACFSRASGFSWQRLWFSIDLSPAVRFKPLFRAYESMLRIEEETDCPPGLKPVIERARKEYKGLMTDLEPKCRVNAFARFQVALCGAASAVIGQVLSKIERQKDRLGTSLDVAAKEIEDVLKDSAKNDPLGANAEEFVGLIYIYAIQHVLMDIRSHILAFTFGYFFLLLALTVYPVGPHHSIMVMMILIFTGFVIAIVVVFSQMHRDSILSRTTSTEPGKLDIGFYEKLISVIGVPLIGLLASAFPEISNFLFSWLEPSLQTLK